MSFNDNLILIYPSVDIVISKMIRWWPCSFLNGMPLYPITITTVPRVYYYAINLNQYLHAYIIR